MSRSARRTPQPHRVRHRARSAVGVAVAALALTGGLAAPAAAAPTADGRLFTGWAPDQDGRSLLLDLEGPGRRDQVAVVWRPTAADAVRTGCQLLVEAPAGGDWAEVGRARLDETESGTRTVALPATSTDRLRVRLIGCGTTRLTPLVERVSVRTASATATALAADFDAEPLGVGPYPWDQDGPVSVDVPPGASPASRALVVREAPGRPRSSAWVWFPRTEQVEVSYRMRVDDPTAQSVVGLRDRTGDEAQTQSIAAVGFAEGRIYAFGQEARTDLGAYEPGRYYTIKIIVRAGDGRFTVDVDGRRAASGLAVRPSAATTVNSLIVAGSAGADATWIDDVTITTTDETVPERVFRGPFDTAPLRRLGTLAPPAPADGSGFASSTFSIGAETLDRRYADISSYIGAVCRLGIGSARLQAGWNRIETRSGSFDWTALDAEVAALAGCGVRPWIELSYGNLQVPGGGGAGLGGALPTNLTAWRAFVTAAVQRYGDRVTTWSIWNEPDLGGVPAAAYGEFAVVTAQAVDAVQPDAEIVAGNTAGVPVTGYATQVLTVLRDAGALGLVDQWGFHGYPRNPDAQYGDVNPARPGGVQALRAAVDGFDPRIGLFETENGAPSRYSGTFALSNEPWTEISQAKWDTRRMLGDNARGLRTNVFTSADLRYTFTPTTVTWNPKGLLQVDGNKQVVREKAAFRAVQSVATLFRTDGLRRAPDALVRVASEQRLSAFGYRKAGSGEVAVSYWLDSDPPGDSAGTRGFADITVPASAGGEFVVVDVLTGDVHEVPDSRVTAGAGGTTVRVDVSDAPFVLTVPAAVAGLLE